LGQADTGRRGVTATSPGTGWSVRTVRQPGSGCHPRRTRRRGRHCVWPRWSPLPASTAESCWGRLAGLPGLGDPQQLPFQVRARSPLWGWVAACTAQTCQPGCTCLIETAAARLDTHRFDASPIHFSSRVPVRGAASTYATSRGFCVPFLLDPEDRPTTDRPYDLSTVTPSASNGACSSRIRPTR
jgi:hypothetical protein